MKKLLSIFTLLLTSSLAHGYVVKESKQDEPISFWTNDAGSVKKSMEIGPSGVVNFPFGASGVTATLTGTPEINYVIPENSASGWTATAGLINVPSTTSTGAELPRASLSTAVKFAHTTASNYAQRCITIDEADKSKKLKLAWDQRPLADISGQWKVEVYSHTVAACGGTAVKLNLTTDAAGVSLIPNATGEYKTYFDTSTLAFYSVRVVRVSGSDAFSAANVIFGPGVTRQGAVVSYLGELSGFTVSNNGSKTFTIYNKCRRQGNYLICNFALDGNATASSSAATTSLLLNLPSGYTIDTSALPYTGGHSSVNSIGEYAEYGITGAAVHSDQRQIGFSSTTAVYFFLGAGSSTSVRTTDLNVARDMDIEGEFRIPIAEWAGSGTVNLAESEVEYWSHNGTNIVRDATGSSFLTTTPASTSEALTLTGLTFQNGETFSFEMQHGGTGAWVSSSNPSIELLRYDGTNFIGATASMNGGGTMEMIRGKYARASTGAWSGILAGTRWRVIKNKVGQLTGFNHASATQSGLVSTDDQNFVGTKTFGGASSASSNAFSSNVILGANDGGSALNAGGSYGYVWKVGEGDINGYDSVMYEQTKGGSNVMRMRFNRRAGAVEIQKDSATTALPTNVLDYAFDTLILTNKNNTVGNHASIGFKTSRTSGEMAARISSESQASNGRGRLIFQTGNSGGALTTAATITTGGALTVGSGGNGSGFYTLQAAAGITSAQVQCSSNEPAGINSATGNCLFAWNSSTGASVTCADVTSIARRIMCVGMEQ